MILFKKLLRTAWHYKAQFISMILMIAIGMGVFIGFNMEWKSIEVTTNRFFDLTGYADFRIVDSNQVGFTNEQLANVKAIDGVSAATRYLDMKVTDPNQTYDDDNNPTLSLSVIEDYGNPTKLMMMSDTEYDESQAGFYISDKYADIYKYEVGSNLTVKYGNTTITKPILGLVKSGEYMICINESNQQMMPDYSVYAYVFATPLLFQEFNNSIYGAETAIKYTKILVESDNTTEYMESELNNIFGKNNFSLIDKDSDVSYSESRGEMDEGKTMGNFLPIIFIAIAVLTMITTMHRVTVNEKIQIGTLKALGFKNRRILIHYTSYGLFIAGVGGIIGIFLGVLINYIVLNPNGMMATYFDVDKWPYAIPLYVIFVSIAIIALLTLITYLSVRKMLKGTAAETLRPYVPKKHKQLLIEKTKHFEKLSFENRWNIRDVFRNKVRSLMTIVGVAGSTLLLVATLAFLSTFINYLDVLENKSMKYETSIALSTELDESDPLTSMYLLNQTARENAAKVEGDYAAISSVTIDDGTEYISLQVLNKSHDLYGVLDKKCNEITLEDTGVYVSKRVVKENGVNKGDTISVNFISGEYKLVYKVKVIGIITSFSSKCILASEDYINSIKDTTNQMTLPYVISNIYTELTKTEVEALNLDGIVSMSTKSELMKTFDSFLSIFYTMIILFVVFAVLLAIVVLYNLGIMSYFERYRQLATLKVVGFKDKYISKILISQNTWLTIVGIIIGIPIGIAVLYILVALLTGDYELTITFGWYSFAGSILVVYLSSFLVSFFVSKKNKKIDMVEALKGIE